MRHFYDLLQNDVLDLINEANRLNKLFSEEFNIYIDGEYMSLEVYIDRFYFRDFKFRVTFLSINEMREEFGITKYEITESLDKLFLFCELLIAILLDKEVCIAKNQAAKEQSIIIVNNIKALLNKANYEMHEAEEGKIIITEKNIQAVQAINIIDDKNISIKILEYNHYQLRGDLAKKADILRALGSYIEPYLHDKAIKNSNMAFMQTDIGFLLNNLHIRHNNKTGSKANKFIDTIDNIELEKWYDKSYNSILTFIITKEYMPISKEISVLKNQYKF